MIALLCSKLCALMLIKMVRLPLSFWDDTEYVRKWEATRKTVGLLVWKQRCTTKQGTYQPIWDLMNSLVLIRTPEVSPVRTDYAAMGAVCYDNYHSSRLVGLIDQTVMICDGVTVLYSVCFQILNWNMIASKMTALSDLCNEGGLSWNLSTSSAWTAKSH